MELPTRSPEYLAWASFIRQRLGDRATGSAQLRRLGVAPYENPEEAMWAIDEVVFSGHPMPPALAVRIFRLLATLEALGLQLNAPKAGDTSDG